MATKRNNSAASTPDTSSPANKSHPTGASYETLMPYTHDNAPTPATFDSEQAFASCAVGEFEDRRSRFLAKVCHVETQEQAEAFIAQARSIHYDARHNVFAWVLASGPERQSDDGEPSRTAGMPVLDVLKGAGLADVCCVVTRYFGGTLLGPGGLVRAYSQATQAALELERAAGHIVRMCEVVRVSMQLPYASYDTVLHQAQGAGAHVVHTDFGAEVALALDFLAGAEQPFLAAMIDLFNGQNPCQVQAPRFDSFTLKLSFRRA